MLNSGKEVTCRVHGQASSYVDCCGLIVSKSMSEFQISKFKHTEQHLQVIMIRQVPCYYSKSGIKTESLSKSYIARDEHEKNCAGCSESYRI
jgi:hypothetical protein